MMATDFTPQVKSLYAKIGNNTPDAEGLDYWSKQFASGKSVDQVTKDFNSSAASVVSNPATAGNYFYSHVATPGLINTASSVSPEAASKALYQNLLGREGDSEGVRYWADQLASGKSADQVQRDFLIAANGVTAAPEYAITGGGGLIGTSQAPAPSSTTTPPVPAVSAAQSQPPATTTVPAPAATAPAITTTAPSTQAAPTETANLSQWSVTEDQTIEGRLNRLLNQDSEYLQRARTSATQAANRRGLLNSSLAATAGEEAAIGAALPIASADANTYASSAQTNAAAANQNAQFNATARNTSNQFNADWANKNYQQATAIAADLQKSQLDQANKVELANIEANYKTLMQTSSSASQVYSQSVSAITNILQDPNMDAASKTTAYNVIVNNMKTQMNMLGSINGVDLTDLLDFQTAE